MNAFDHPAAHRRHRWNLATASRHQGKVALVVDPEKRTLLAWAYGQLTNQVSPFLQELPWQFDHGDGNPENIRIEGEQIVGLLDLVDCCSKPVYRSGKVL